MNKFVLSMVLAISVFSSQVVAAEEADPLGGWRILMPDYDMDNYLDVLSYEWDYFMIHDADAGFYGVIGYLLSNPRDRLDRIELFPNGANVATAMQIRGQEPISEYVNFGARNYEASDTERYLDAWNDNGDFAKISPLRGGGTNGEDAVHLQGRSNIFEWDLVVTQDWAERPAPGPRMVSGDDVGYLPGEVWSVDVLWPRTHVVGTVVAVESGEVFDIDSHGYRENAWGRYNLVPDGWDFSVFSEDTSDLLERGVPVDQGVQMVFQTYHKSDLLDWSDISFYRNEELVNLRFYADDGELSWNHTEWRWDRDSWNCVPLGQQIVMENDEYRIVVDVSRTMQDEYPLLNDATLPVSLYFIQHMYSNYDGEIIDLGTGETVRRFNGKGIAELSMPKSTRLWPASSRSCTRWGNRVFHHR